MPAKPTPRSARTKRDNARARKLGYRSYYDFRLHGSGRVPPSKAVPADRRALRGHSLDRWRKHGDAAKMLRAITPGVTISLTQPISQIREPRPLERRAHTSTGKLRFRNGRQVWETVDVYPEIEKLLIGNDGYGREYTIRNVSRPELVLLIEEEIRRGGSFVHAPSFDQRRLVTEDEAEGGY